MSSILQPVDVNVGLSPVRKRARYDDTGNEYNKHERWSFHKNEVVLHETFDHGVGRLDCDTEEIYTDDDTIFNRNIPGSIDISCASMTPNTREKQLSLLESTLPKESLDKLTLGEWDNVLCEKIVIKPTDKTNHFDLLADEIILNILRWLPKTCLPEIALVCKRFSRLIQDESLWTRMDVSGKNLSPGRFGKILSNQVIILRASAAVIHSPILVPNIKAALSDFTARLLYLDLGMSYITCESLVIIFNKCRRLKKLNLEHVEVNDEVLIALSANKDIEVLNLSMSLGIEEDGLKYLLTNCRKIRELNIAWTDLSHSCVKYISKNLPSSMDRLNFSGCKRNLTDQNVTDIVMCCPRLRELDLSDCTSITGHSVKQFLQLDELNFLALSRCYQITYTALFHLKKLHSLSFLDIHGGYNALDELKAIQDTLGARVQINKFKFSSVARPTVGMRRSSIWNMRVRD